MNKVLLITGLAACLPLTALADVKIASELNGLDIETSLSLPPFHLPDSSAISRGASQILKVTNHGAQSAVCTVKPGVAEALSPSGRKMLLEPGTSVVVLVDSRPIGRSTQASLACTPDRSS